MSLEPLPPVWQRESKHMEDVANESMYEGELSIYRDVVVDLETMGTGADCAVLSIGAVRVRLDGRDSIETIKEPRRSFYGVLDTDTQRLDGRSVDDDTMEWWDEQSPEARAVFGERGEHPRTVLKRFVEFCKGAKRIWGNGNMFDNNILRSLSKDYQVEYPVDYWNDLDVRTLTYLWNKLTNFASKGKRPAIKVGVAHHALDDARSEALQMQKMYQDIKGKDYGT